MSTWTPEAPETKKTKNDREIFNIAAETQWAKDMVDNTGPFANGKYSVKLSGFSDVAADKFREQGCSVQSSPELGNYTTFKSTNPMKAYLEDGSEVDPKIIGNGSKVRARVSSYEWPASSPKEGFSPTLIKLTITDLKTYEPEESQADEEVF